jgi:hypothetical protein
MINWISRESIDVEFQLMAIVNASRPRAMRGTSSNNKNRENARRY